MGVPQKVGTHTEHYRRKPDSFLLIAYLISEYGIHFSLVWVQWGLCVLVIGYLLYLALRERQRSYFLIALFAIGSIGFLYSSNYVFDNSLGIPSANPHQGCTRYGRRPDGSGI